MPLPALDALSPGAAGALPLKQRHGSRLTVPSYSSTLPELKVTRSNYDSFLVQQQGRSAALQWSMLAPEPKAGPRLPPLARQSSSSTTLVGAERAAETGSGAWGLAIHKLPSLATAAATPKWAFAESFVADAAPRPVQSEWGLPHYPAAQIPFFPPAPQTAGLPNVHPLAAVQTGWVTAPPQLNSVPPPPHLMGQSAPWVDPQRQIAPPSDNALRTVARRAPRVDSARRPGAQGLPRPAGSARPEGPAAIPSGHPWPEMPHSGHWSTLEIDSAPLAENQTGSEALKSAAEIKRKSPPISTTSAAQCRQETAETTRSKLPLKDALEATLAETPANQGAARRNSNPTKRGRAAWSETERQQVLEALSRAKSPSPETEKAMPQACSECQRLQTASINAEKLAAEKQRQLATVNDNLAGTLQQLSLMRAELAQTNPEKADPTADVRRWAAESVCEPLENHVRALQSRLAIKDWTALHAVGAAIRSLATAAGATLTSAEPQDPVVKVQPRPPPSPRPSSGVRRGRPPASWAGSWARGGTRTATTASSTASRSMASQRGAVLPALHGSSAAETAAFAFAGACGPTVGTVRAMDVVHIGGPTQAQVLCATAGSDGTPQTSDRRISLWQLRSGGQGDSGPVLLGTLDNATSKTILTLAFHPTEPHLLLSSDLEFDVKLWDTRSGACLRVWRKLHTRIIYRVGVVPHSPARAVSCSADHSIKLFWLDGEDGMPLVDEGPSIDTAASATSQRRRGHVQSVNANEPFTSFCFCGDAQAQTLIAALSYALRIYKMRTMTLLHTIALPELRTNQTPVTALHPHPHYDNHVLVSCDNQIRLFDLTSESTLRVFCAREIGPGTRIEGRFSPCGAFVYATATDMRSLQTRAFQQRSQLVPLGGPASLGVFIWRVQSGRIERAELAALAASIPDIRGPFPSALLVRWLQLPSSGSVRHCLAGVFSDNIVRMFM